MSQHRDNSNTAQFTSLVEKLCNGDVDMSDSEMCIPRSGQTACSNVVVFTLGSAPMQMLLRYPRASDLMGSRKHYVEHASFKVCLSVGTIWVWDAVDDIFFTHEAHFISHSFDDVGESGWREAYVFRHVDVIAAFHCAPEHRNSLFVTLEQAACDVERKRKKSRRQAMQRREMQASRMI